MTQTKAQMTADFLFFRHGLRGIHGLLSENIYVTLSAVEGSQTFHRDPSTSVGMT